MSGTNKIKNFIHKKRTGIFFASTIFFVVFIIYITPIISFNLGNIFFGDVKPLYNVKLAQILYKQSVNPIFPQLPPPYAHHQLSRTYFIQGNLWKALDEAKEELKIYPNNKQTYYILGLTYGYLNLEGMAIEMFSKFIEYKPNSWAARNDKAWLQFRIGNIDDAIETIKPVVEIEKYNVWVQNTYCALLINKKMLVEAKDVCEKAKILANSMTEKDWGRAYPGNDPRIYSIGLEAMKTSIENNLQIINERITKP